MTTAKTDKKPRHWIPNPEGRGLPPKRWKSPTATTRVPKAHKQLIGKLAIALDQGSITPEQVEALIRGQQHPADIHTPEGAKIFTPPS